MNDPSEAIDVLSEATALNRDEELLRGSVLHFPDYGQVVMTGDLHGHRRNFGKIQTLCDLARSPARHVVIHELIHEEPEAYDAPDTSFEVLIEAAAWKCRFPDQVHFLMGNHELAQFTGHEIAKNGRVVTYEYERSVRQAFGPRGDDVNDAMKSFMQSFPLAARTQTGVFLSHSLPGPREIDVFDPGLFDRAPTAADFSEFGSAYLLVWGRYQRPENIERMSRIVGADFFICGHQPQEFGFAVLYDRMIILASDHNHGVCLPIDLSVKPQNVSDLTRRIKPLAAVE
ncbi:MAG: hypothetical protein C4547_10960 [Phycisphaerales bacterium]|nr:MAG: hypothetical protein C4547_10960 [Phycisphaerales bacterium]